MPDDGAQFHTAFTAAAKESGNSNGPQIKTSKTQMRDTKPQSSESKKKEATSEAVAASIAVPEAPAPKESASSAVSLATIGSSVKGEASAQTFEQSLKIASPATAKSSTEKIAVTGKLDVSIPSSQGDERAASTGSAESFSDAKSNHEDLEVMQHGQSQAEAVQSAPIAASAPIFENGTWKTVNAEDGTDSPKPGEVSKPTSSENLVDPGVIAAQQKAAFTQSVAAPGLPGDLTSGTEFQATLPVATSKITAVNPPAERVKEAASGRADSTTKAKPAASDPKSKRSDDAGSESQSNDATVATSNTFAAKVSEASIGVNHSAGEPKGAFDVAGVQQITQAIQPAVSNHGPDTAQSASLAAEPAVQPAQVPSENPAMQGVSSAQLVQSMHSSEMKLGMQSAEFGNISISTSLNHQAISAQISIDHSELGRALAVHLPAIEEKLGSAYGVQAKVELRDTNNPSQSSDSGYSNSGQQSREQRQSQTGATATIQGAMYQRIAGLAGQTTTSAAASTSRLDIRI